MTIHPLILWTDALIYLLLITMIGLFFYLRTIEHFRIAWQHVIQRKAGIVCMVILAVYVMIALLDSLHFELVIPDRGIVTESVFDVLMSPLDYQDEKTYSAPFATTLFTKIPVYQADGHVVFSSPVLQFVNPTAQDSILKITSKALIKALALWLIFSVILLWVMALAQKIKFKKFISLVAGNKTFFPYTTLLISIGVVLVLGFVSYDLSRIYHILGTDKVGHDVFYESLKSIRTGLVIGTLTTMIIMPFAVVLGMCAGYFGGKIDDVIQYLYTTVSSVPDVLLIAAAILSIDVYISNHPDFFPNTVMRADIRLFALCCILGITSWTGLCRLLRGETLKLRELDYVQASRALGANSMQIIFRHILPNLMHLILIAVVMDFSGLVLAEAVLTYVGVGVDPSTISWGNMINAARLELARDPVVWWPLFSAFIFMFVLVVAANIFADIIRDALDPRIQISKV